MKNSSTQLSSSGKPNCNFLMMHKNLLWYILLIITNKGNNFASHYIHLKCQLGRSPITHNKL